MTAEQKVRHAVEAWMRSNPLAADRLHPQATPDAFFEVDDWDLGALVPHLHVNLVEGRVCVNRMWARATDTAHVVKFVGRALDRMTWDMVAEQGATPAPAWAMRSEKSATPAQQDATPTPERTTWIDRVLDGIRAHAERWAVVYMFLAVGVLAGALVGLALAFLALILGR